MPSATARAHFVGVVHDAPLAMTNASSWRFSDARCQDLAVTVDHVPADEPEDEHELGLPDSTRAVLSLQIHLRVLINIRICHH